MIGDLAMLALEGSAVRIILADEFGECELTLVDLELGPRNGGISGMSILGRTEARVGVALRCGDVMSKVSMSEAMERWM